MAYCTKGKELLLDLQRSDWLPAYDEDGIRSVLGEIDDISTRVHELFRPDMPPNEKANIIYLHACGTRNMQYSQAYFLHRMNKLRSIRWEAGPVLPDHLLQKKTLNPAEEAYFNDYNDLLADYFEKIDLDLAADLEPPRDLMVEIRVLQNCGEIITENGSVSLDKGSTHFLRRSDIEHLIRLGKVEMFAS
eukprot:GSChrysophyteH1.ASY1.ANO1.899.1 assembled CDS